MSEKKLTQAELLELLSPPPFNQKKCVPPDAVILTSPEERWWRRPVRMSYEDVISFNVSFKVFFKV